jgi:ABC-2 type transport system permease protein
MLPESTAGGAPARSGAIYDLGYQGYDGPRLGRRAAIATLFSSSWRAAFGLGRSGRAKIVPWGLTVIALLPAAIAVGIVALVGNAIQPFSYDNYLSQIQVALTLFVAAQAPELGGGDQRNRVLSLYFSHAILRLDYAAAKLAALTAALLMLTVAPQLVLFAGKVLSATDVLAALGDEAPKLIQIVVSSAVYSLTLAIIGLAIAAFTPRRAYATGAIIAFFLVAAIVSAMLSNIGSPPLAWAPLLDPVGVADAVNQWLFTGSALATGREGSIDNPAWWYLVTLAAVWLVGIAVIVVRYRRIQA